MLFLLNCNIARAEGWLDIGQEAAINTQSTLSDNSLAVSLRFNYVRNKYLYSLGYKEGVEFFFDNNDFKELSAGWGRHYANRFGATTIQTGFGVRNFENNSTESSRFFVPLSATLILGKYVGISQSLSLNVSRDPTIGYEVSYSFGKFN